MSDIDDWWEGCKKEAFERGRADALTGQPTHPYDDGDEMDAELALYYKDGFMDERLKLGNKFKWAGEK